MSITLFPDNSDPPNTNYEYNTFICIFWSVCLRYLLLTSMSRLVYCFGCIVCLTYWNEMSYWSKFSLEYCRDTIKIWNSMLKSLSNLSLLNIAMNWLSFLKKPWRGAESFLNSFLWETLKRLQRCSRLICFHFVRKQNWNICLIISPVSFTFQICAQDI